MKVYIINPDNNQPVTIEKWRKDADPTRARLLAIENDEGRTLLMSKSLNGDNLTFDQAQEAAAAFKPEGLESLTFRCPTRKECCDIWDARDQGLDEAIELTGGDRIEGWYWTSERWLSRRFNAGSGWYFYGSNGSLYANHVNFAYRVQAVTLLT